MFFIAEQEGGEKREIKEPVYLSLNRKKAKNTRRVLEEYKKKVHEVLKQAK